METLLHHVWKHKLYESGNFRTTDGTPFEIIDPGIYNTDAGPDFFNAKIKIEGKVWAGNIEIHTASSDWYKHRHEKDRAYNSVVLHVVESLDELEIRDESGRLIPQWIMKIPHRVGTNYLFLLNNDSSIPCLGGIHEIPEIYLTDWKSALLTKTSGKTTASKNLKKTLIWYITILSGGFQQTFRISRWLNAKCALISRCNYPPKRLPRSSIFPYGERKLCAIVYEKK
ncbi:hypothetical protein FACS189432_07630 [Bacteroidia bacterium]|nr:hypothetical protein FACS189432_07630 [Bacteroidia bacterium]